MTSGAVPQIPWDSHCNQIVFKGIVAGFSYCG